MLLMSPSRDIIKGSSLTFNCGCDANPPVTQSGYSLHKDKQLISFGQSHTISVLQSNDSGRYYCKAWNNISWRGATYFTSTEVHVDVRCKFPRIIHMKVSGLLLKTEYQKKNNHTAKCHKPLIVREKISRVFSCENTEQTDFLKTFWQEILWKLKREEVLCCC